jgi:hypothetical protein
MPSDSKIQGFKNSRIQKFIHFDIRCSIFDIHNSFFGGVPPTEMLGSGFSFQVLPNNTVGMGFPLLSLTQREKPRRHGGKTSISLVIGNLVIGNSSEILVFQGKSLPLPSQ